MPIAREEALKLLCGGDEGVAKWNRKRDAGEIDLKELQIRGKNLKP